MNEGVFWLSSYPPFSVGVKPNKVQSPTDMSRELRTVTTAASAKPHLDFTIIIFCQEHFTKTSLKICGMIIRERIIENSRKHYEYSHFWQVCSNSVNCGTSMTNNNSSGHKSRLNDKDFWLLVCLK
uniref:Uncharacterized protein n=1 Tax=Sinocyclocheilus anshuiensis TaxID=1608454 RepID=A0A671LQD8_9TELE